MPVNNGTDPTIIAAWLASAASMFGILFGMAKVRAGNLKRIDDAKAEGTEAKTACERLHQKLLESELSATEKYASIPHLKSVERNMKDEMKAVEERSKETIQLMEERLVSAIKERRENFHG